jgi:hypothetical protein
MFCEQRILQGAQSFYPEEGKESKRAMAIVLFRAYHREMSALLCAKKEDKGVKGGAYLGISAYYAGFRARNTRYKL